MSRRRGIHDWSLESLESRRCLSVTTLVPHLVDPPETVGLTDVKLADLDGDLDLDVVSTSRVDGRVAWYENLDGRGTYGAQRLVGKTARAGGDIFALDSPSSSAVTDLDGDDDLDLIVAFEFRIVWFENLNGRGQFGEERLVSDERRGVAFNEIWAGDWDRDGDQDVLSIANATVTLAWFENADSRGTFDRTHILRTASEPLSDLPTSATVTDLNGDGFHDIVVTTNREGSRWFPGIGNERGFGDPLDLPTLRPGWGSLAAADLDGDGDQDLVESDMSSRELIWYQNLDHRGSFADATLVAPATHAATAIVLTDFDVDGDIDIVACLEDGLNSRIVLYMNSNGGGQFVSGTMATDLGADIAAEFVAGDIDSDGRSDLVATKTDHRLSWYRNLNDNGTLSSVHWITDSVRASTIRLVDWDGDGDLDLLARSQYDNTLVWYANQDGRGKFGRQQLLSFDISFSLGDEPLIGDLDRDGYVDVIYRNRSNQLIWHSNWAGTGGLGEAHAVADDVVRAIADDVDGDGDLDIVYSAYTAAKTFWVENIDGRGTFGVPRAVRGSCRQMITADLDGDGDQDLVATDASRMEWHPNEDGKGTFGSPRPIGRLASDFGYWDAITAIDLDRDGDLDILATSRPDDGRLVWLENVDGRGTFGAERLIASANASNSAGVALATGDVDGDGQIDVFGGFSNEIRVAHGVINSEGRFTFGESSTVIASWFSTWAMATGDVDRDGRLDLVVGDFNSRSDLGIERLMWLENRLIGDSDDDGSFDSSDLIAVFQAGKYESTEATEVTFAEGDWNQDGHFDSADFVIAFQSGNYRQ